MFASPDGTILDPDNLYHRYFIPASIVYVKEHVGHSSIHVTVDTYGHLIPGAVYRNEHG